MMSSWIISLLFLTHASWAALPSQVTGIDLTTGAAAQVSLITSSGKASIVVFLSAKCPCSQSHEVTLANLAKEFGPQGFRFVGVHSNSDESSELSIAHFKSSALPFPVVQDQSSQLATAFGALKTPHVFVLQKGELVFSGGVDNSKTSSNANQHYLRLALEKISEGKLPEVREVRTLGCVIQRKESP